MMILAAIAEQIVGIRIAGQASDVAQSMIVTAWNLAIAGGGIVGGLLLEHSGVHGLSWVALTLLMSACLVAFLAKSHGFPPRRRAL